MPDSPVLHTIVEILVRAYEPEAIYLFGSTARGDIGPDSDLDLLIVVPDDATGERLRPKLGYKALRGTGTAVDILVCRTGDFDREAGVEGALPCTVRREGRLVYAR